MSRREFLLAASGFPGQIGRRIVAVRAGVVPSSRSRRQRPTIEYEVPLTMAAAGSSLYRLLRGILGTALGFYFSRIERFHAERVPRTGPVLFTSNHPNSLTDAFVIGFSVSRKVNFVATVELFRFKPVRWLLTQCGVIAINRVKDDPRAMRSVLDTFAACFRVLEQGEAVGIFPEGITHDDPQLKTVKTGAARLALELEHRHSGQLGLQIVPVGLTFSAKEVYRSEVLVNFGEPIHVAEFLGGYAEKRHDCIHGLTAEIEHRIESLILHLPNLERARVVEAVKRLYLERLLVAGRMVHEPKAARAEELVLVQAIANAVEYAFQHQPERAKAFCFKLDQYEHWLRRLSLSDETLAAAPGQRRLAVRNLGWALMAVVGVPLALYGWVHRWAPYVLIRWAVGRFAKIRVDKTHVSTVSLMAGVVGFGVAYGLYIGLFQALFGWPLSLYYALSLPVASLAAYYYLREVRRLAGGLRTTLVLLRAPLATRRLLARRAELIAEIDGVRRELAGV